MFESWSLSAVDGGTLRAALLPALSLAVVLAVRVWARRRSAAAAGGDRVRRVAQLVVYPIKSCAGVPVRRWPLGRRGLRDDRRWMLVDAAGEFISQVRCAACRVAALRRSTQTLHSRF